MKFLRTTAAKSVCLATGLLALVSVASASQIRMHVPVAASWAGRMLPAGDYRLDISAASPLAQVSGNGKLVTVFITSAKPWPVHDHSLLRIVNVDGTPTVAGFGLASQGMNYEFVVPKSASHGPGAGDAAAGR